MEYTLSKHRFYELKHFCLQYPEWKRLYLESDGWSGKGDTTSRDGIRRADICRYVELIENCVRITDSAVFPYIVSNLELPTELRYSYRKFFWELSKRR